METKFSPQGKNILKWNLDLL